MTFSVSGKANSGIFNFGVYLVIFLLGGISMIIFPLFSGDFHVGFLLMGLMLIGFSGVIFIPLRLSMKKKTIMIDDGLVSLFIGDDLKTSVHLEEVTKVETVSLRGKTPRGGFVLKKGKKMVLECNWRDHMDKEKLITAFHEILKYQHRYDFKVNDPLRWG